MGRDSSVGIATSYRAGRSGNRIPVGAKFSAPVQTDPGAYPASCTMGTRSFPRGKAAGAWWSPPTPPSKCRRHERVGLYLCSTSGPSWSVTGWSLIFFWIQLLGIEQNLGGKVSNRPHFGGTHDVYIKTQLRLHYPPPWISCTTRITSRHCYGTVGYVPLCWLNILQMCKLILYPFFFRIRCANRFNFLVQLIWGYFILSSLKL